MNKPYKFSQDVYDMPWEDFKVFVKGRYPELRVKDIKELHKNGKPSAISGKTGKNSQ